MAFNGSGTFALYSPGNPVVTGTTISSTWANNTLSDLATGLSTCVTKDGQTTTTARIPFAAGISNGSQTLTAVAAGTATTHAATVGQLQSSAVNLLGTIAGTNTITAVGTPTVAAYASGQTFRFIPANTNTGATTLNIDSLGAKNVYWNNAACVGGEILQNVPCEVMYDGTQFQVISGAVSAYQGSGLVLLGTGTASTSASISFTSRIDSTFDNYVIYFSNVVPATNATNLLVTLSQDSGSTYLSASYHYASWAVNDGGSSGAGASASASNILVAGALSNSGGQGCSGWLSISNPFVSSTYKTVNWMLGYQASTGAVNTVSGSAQYQGDGNAINAIKFAMSSGNLATGNFQLYGLRKS